MLFSKKKDNIFNIKSNNDDETISLINTDLMEFKEDSAEENIFLEIEKVMRA